MRQLLFLIGALLLGAPSAHAQLTDPAFVLSYVRAGDLHLNSAGSELAYVANSYAWDYKSRIRVMTLATGAELELTPAGKTERAPRWSPDGRTLAFLSNRNGTTQVYAMPAAGGDPAPLTSRKFGVRDFRWSPDGKTIAYLAKDDDAPPTEDGPQVADAEANLTRLWVLDLRTQTSRRLGVAGFRIDEIQWLDSSHILLVATDRPRVEAFEEALYSLSTADGSVQRVATPPEPFDSILVSPNGKLILRSTSRKGPIARDLFQGDAAGGPLHNVSGKLDLEVAEVRWRTNGDLWVRAVDGFYNRIYRLGENGEPRPLKLELSVNSFDVAPDGAVAFAGEDFQHLPEIYLRSPDGAVRQLSNLQPVGWARVRLAKSEIFQVRSFDGAAVEAVLLKPAAPAPTHARAPLVLLAHGGPSGVFSAGYSWEAAWAQMLVAHGYQVLMANPRGSTGYSEQFLMANRGDWGGGDYKDLIAVLDAVVAKGEVDPQRLGIGGWSYGGEMTNWAITQTHRFKAAVSGAGVYDQQAEFESEAHSEGDEWYFGTPWDHPDVFAKNSPATYIRKARTPTLILDGEEDRNNPVFQSSGLYRALKHLGVETELVTYPGEGHSPRRGSYNIDMFERILRWYDRFLAPPAP